MELLSRTLAPLQKQYWKCSIPKECTQKLGRMIRFKKKKEGCIIFE